MACLVGCSAYAQGRGSQLRSGSDSSVDGDQRVRRFRTAARATSSKNCEQLGSRDRAVRHAGRVHRGVRRSASSVLQEDAVCVPCSGSSNPAATPVRVATFNILSPELCNPSWYCACDPADLDSDVRLQRVMKQLDEEVDKRAIICLQEVSMEWSGPLYTYLVTAGYTFLYSSYGNDKNGYMGVGVAVPTDRFELLNADISRLADTVQWPRVNAAASGGMDSSDELLGSASTDEDGEAESSDFTSMDEDGPSSTSQDEASISEQLRKGRRRMSRKEKKLAKKVMEGKVQLGLGGRNRTPHRLSSALDAINISVSLNRKNCIVSAKLRCRRTDIAFGVSTYHMPCAFKKEAVMMVHAALAFQHAHRLANGSPYIFCGDFNIKPSDAIYSLITMGEAPPSEGSPSYISYDGWSSKVPERMASAYCQVHGSEPDFTNYSVLPHQKFVDVLDYIFLSNGCQATEVRDLPAIQDISRALPNREQPSDHLMIAATVRIQS